MSTTLAKLARELNSTARSGRGLPALVLLSDRRRLADPIPAAKRLPLGAAVILRHYDAPERADLARRLARICRERRILLLVAGDGALAAEVGAAGLHFPESRVAECAVWRDRRQDWLITAAAHSLPALMRAHAAGADAALLAPVFATASHPDARPIGPLRFARLVRASPLPVYALGGVNRATAARLKGSGAVGIAAISGIADD